MLRYSNICSSFSAAVLSELFRKWLYMSVVVLVRAWPALPATVTSGTPAAIDSKTFTDYGPLLPLSRIRTVPLSPDSVKRWAHFHRDGSLGAWSCLCNIIAQMFDKFNLTPVSKWVWERNCKKYFQFSRYSGNLSNQWASLLSTYKHAFKNTICSILAKFF